MDAPTSVGQRSQRVCIYCRFFRRKCIHPAKERQPGKCDQCSAKNLPCGPPELAEESLRYLIEQEPRPTLPVYRFEDNFAFNEPIPTDNVGQIDTSKSYEAAANIPSSHDASLTSTTSSFLDSVGGTSASPFAQQDLRTQSIDQPIDYLAEYTYSDAESYMAAAGTAAMSPPLPAPEQHRGHIHTSDHFAESDLGNMSPFIRYDQLRVYQEHIETLRGDSPAQDSLDRSFHYASEPIKTELDRAVNRMIELWHQAQDTGNTDQARWMCFRVTRAIESSNNAMEQRREELLRILEFYKGSKDVVEADRIFQVMLQHGLIDTTTVPKAAELCTSSFRAPLGYEVVDENIPGNILPNLHRQIELGSTALVPLLQVAAASGVIPRPDFLGRSLLHVAAEKGLVVFLEVILSLGESFPNFRLNIESRDAAHRTPLHLTIQKGHESAYQFLRQRGAKLGRNHTSHSPLASAAGGGHIRIMEDLLKAKCEVNEKTLFGDYPPLHAAAANGQYEAVRILLNNRANPKLLMMPEKKTASQLAQDNGHMEVVELINNGG